ncbi:MAG: RnfABCDGE type electron transport complex subunit A [Clostridia bacterium]|jgi:electron transport complex protein RnfA|nr:RnfABCDGE type electron transport complex subunit A [Clostridia bacterium]MBQ1942272.1 RnfABCDGE type electron transport complex subunit A [Clostridia bacterium]MBQ5802372.1 RnfABCDGE type electron transport complex subunit A [Clostridia bacterium]
MNTFFLMFGAIVTGNVVLTQFQGCCPFLGVSKKQSTALGMGCAVTFVLTVSGAATYAVYHLLLEPLHIPYMMTMAFILVIASLVQMTEMVIRKISPTLYRALGVYLPLITTNCAVLGTAISTVNSGYDFLQTVLFSFATGVGFLLAIFLLSGIRKKMQGADIPKPFEGFPITLLAAAIMALAFAGFAGITF